MAGVVSPLETNNEIRLAGEQVNDLALALVTPLRSHHHGI
jgi:hypothetical protein